MVAQSRSIPRSTIVVLSPLLRCAAYPMARCPSIIADFVGLSRLGLAAKPVLARETAALASSVSELLVAVHATD